MRALLNVISLCGALSLVPTVLCAAGRERVVKVGGVSGLALRSGGEAPWHWKTDAGRKGQPALTSGALTTAGAASWLELSVKGPTRLYFWSRTEAEVGTWPEADPPVLWTNWQETNWSNSDVRYGMVDIGASEPANSFDSIIGSLPITSLDTQVQLPANEMGLMGGRPIQVGWQSIGRPVMNTLTFTRQPAYTLLTDGREMALPTSRTEASAMPAETELLATDGDWSEHALRIPRGRHTIRWRFTKDAAPVRSVTLDGLRLESGEALVITSARSLTASAGQPFTSAMRTNGRAHAFSAENLPEGLSISPATGVISGTVAQSGIFTAQVTARQTRGRSTDSIAVRIEVQADAGAAVDEPRLVWTQGRDVPAESLPCAIEVSTTAEGGDALRVHAGAWLETVLTGPEKLSFVWQAEGLRVTMDGADVPLPASGQQGWTATTLDIPAGVHRVRWQGMPVLNSNYITTTDLAFSERSGDRLVTFPFYQSGSQSFLMDDVRLGTRSRPRMTAPGWLDVSAQQFFSHRIAVEGATSVTATGLPEGMTLQLAEDGRSVEMRGRPATPGLYAVKFTASSPGGIAECSTTLQVDPPIGPALGSGSLVWRTNSGGGKAWVADPPGETSTDTQAPADSAGAVRLRSRVEAASNESAWIETDVTGPEVLHFRWWGGSVVVLLDGVPVDGLMSSGQWRAVSVAIPAGVHTVRWQAGANVYGAALDEVRLSSDARSFVLDEPVLAFTALRPGAKTLTLTRSTAVVSATGALPPGLQLLSNGMLRGTAARSGTWPVEITTTTPAGTVSRPMTITVAPPCLPDWLAAHRLTGADLTSDADHDGLPLLVEFALGGDPAKPDRDLDPRLTIGKDRVFWEFPRGDYDTAAVRVSTEFSKTMRQGTWIRYPCFAREDASGRPVQSGSLNRGTAGGEGYFRIRADVPAPPVTGRD